MTIIADLPAGYTVGDGANIRKAIWDVQLASYTTLSRHDWDALAKLYLWPGLDQAAIELIALICSARQPLPLDDVSATLLHSLLKLMPSPTFGELSAWMDAQKPQTDSAERAVATLAAHVAERESEPGGDLLRSALLATVRAARPDLSIHEAPALAARLVEQARQAMELADSPAAVA